VADLSSLTVQVTLTLGEMRNLVAMTALAREILEAEGAEVPEIVDEVSGLYFEMMALIQQDGTLGDFEPE
jgi:hypothetical protein